jgi:hypothetical protein
MFLKIFKELKLKRLSLLVTFCLLLILPAVESALKFETKKHPHNLHSFKVVSMPNLNELVNAEASLESNSDFSDERSINQQLGTTRTMGLGTQHTRLFLI